MMILWLKQSDTCVNGGLLNNDILIKTNVSIVVYWMMIFWLKQMCQWWFIEWWYFDKNKCVSGGLLNDDILIKTKWYLTNVSIVVYWMMIFWLKQMCQ